MRRIGYGVLLVFGLAVAVWAVLAATRWLQGVRLEHRGDASARTESVLFEPGSRGELRFNLAGHERWMVLQAFPVAALDERREGLSLAFDVEIQGGPRTVRQRHFLGLPALADARPWAMDGSPAGGEVWIYPPLWIDLTTHPQASRLTVRAIDPGPAGGRVLWRAALERELDAEQARARYRQMGASRQEAITRHWVMPPSLVPPEQRQDLLRLRRERLAPIGREGVDYLTRRVLLHGPSRRDVAFARRDWAWPISPALHVALDVSAPVNVVLDARDADGAPLRLDVSGPEGQSARHDGRWQGAWAPGRYELRADRPGTIELRDEATGTLLLPSGVRTRYSRLAMGERLRFRLHALGDGPPPVRLRARPLSGDVEARLTFLDAQARPLATRVVTVPWRPSPYDRRLASPAEPASESQSVELQPPATASVLEIEADDALLVAALTTANARPGRGTPWFSFLPEGDRRATLAVDEWVVEQPSPRVAARMPSRPAVPGPVRRLRLRAEGDDEGEGEGDDAE